MISDKELGQDLIRVILKLAELAETGEPLEISSGPLAGHEQTLLAAAPPLAALHQAWVSERISQGLATAWEQGRRGGRRKVTDETTLAALGKLIASGRPMTEAAKIVGISRATAYRVLPPGTVKPSDVPEEGEQHVPEWYKIREAIGSGASNTQELAIIFNVGPGTITNAFRRMPDGEEQKTRMKANRPHPAPSEDHTYSLHLGQPVPDDAVALLRGLQDHYEEQPAPPELTRLIAKLMRGGASTAAIALVVNRPLYIIQGWAAQGGYITQANLARHAEIREAIDAGAQSMKDVADLLGISRERVRQLTHSMPDFEDVHRALRLRRTVDVDTLAAVQQEIAMPTPAPEQAPEPVGESSVTTRQITDKERVKLLTLISQVRALPRFAPPAARRVIIQRDELARKLYDTGVTIQDLADAVEVSPGTIRDWTSPAKQYRRQLHNKVASSRRAKRH